MSSDAEHEESDTSLARFKQPKPKKPSDYSSTIIIEVGPYPQTRSFTVHNDYLKASSTYFRAALEGDWTERHNGRFELPEDDAGAFQIYVHWLYTRKIDWRQGLSETQLANLRSVDVAVESCYAVLITSYVLADKRGLSSFQNGVLDALITTFDNGCQLPGPEHVEEAYNNTLGGSSLRRLLSDYWTWGSDSEIIEELSAADYPAEFGMDCFKAHWKAAHKHGIPTDGDALGERVAPYTISPCASYHEHAQGEQVPCEHHIDSDDDAYNFESSDDDNTTDDESEQDSGPKRKKPKVAN